jgi:uncharacterized damage-inducible protein DinB
MDDDGMPARTANEFVHGLNTTWAVIQTGLNRWKVEDLAEGFHWPGSGQSRSYKRGWIIWHVLEHDIHHGGELSFMLGAHNIPAIDL